MYLEEADRRPFGWFLANYLILDEPQGEFSLQIGGKVRTMLLNLRFFRDRHGQRLHRLNLTDITELRQVRESLRQLTEQLLTFQEMERRRIARDLHDELGQSLMALKMKLNSVMRSFRRGEEPWEDFGRAIDYVNTIATKARNICQSLRPSVLEDLGLDQALHQLLEEFREQHELELLEELEGLGGLFSAESQIAIYRIIQECLNNPIRHGEATRVRVGAQNRDGAVCFICEDNGVGFDLAEVRARGEASRGSGLIAVGERVRLLHGSLKITSDPGQGCRIVFTLPTDQKPA
jgi:signal transduction histidine kinase